MGDKMKPSDYLEIIEYDDEEICNEMDEVFIDKKEVISKKELYEYFNSFDLISLKDNLLKTFEPKLNDDKKEVEIEFKNYPDLKLLMDFQEKMFKNFIEMSVTNFVIFKDKIKSELLKEYTPEDPEAEILEKEREKSIPEDGFTAVLENVPEKIEVINNLEIFV